MRQITSHAFVEVDQLFVLSQSRLDSLDRVAERFRRFVKTVIHVMLRFLIREIAIRAFFSNLFEDRAQLTKTLLNIALLLFIAFDDRTIDELKIELKDVNDDERDEKRRNRDDENSKKRSEEFRRE